jgi:Helix-turn-helix domain
VSIGEALAEARRRAGLTVAQVGHQTGISEASITAIEGNDYSACSDDSYARWYIRSIARAVGANPEPLLREYKTGRPPPRPVTDDVTAPATDDVTAPATGTVAVRATGTATAPATGTVAAPAADAVAVPAIGTVTAPATDTVPAADPVAAPATDTTRSKWLWRAWLVVVAVVVVWTCLVVFQHHAGRPHRVTGAPPAHSAAHRHSGHHGQASAARTETTGSVRTLTPVSAAAFGPDGVGHGDNSGLAPLAIDTNPGTAWRTDWYASAHFGNLYPGTGLLVDMGRRVTITSAQLTLGRDHGAGLQLRIGAAPALADLPPVAQAANAGGVVRLRLARPAPGRYVLIWFTSLAHDAAGTFQASVYSLRLEGRA